MRRVVRMSFWLLCLLLPACSDDDGQVTTTDVRHPCDVVTAADVGAATDRSEVTAQHDGSSGCSYSDPRGQSALLTRRGGSDSTAHFLASLRVGGFTVEPLGRAQLAKGPGFHYVI